MYDDLSNAFPGFTHFYTINGLSMNDALERCARLTGEDAHVFNYQNQIVFALQHEISNDNSWLVAVPGTPVDVEPTTSAPTTTAAPK